MTGSEGRPVVRGLRQGICALAALDDEQRRRLYAYVRDCPDAVSRDEAAAGVGISSRLAAFHLDKLVRRGLLAAHYARKPGRSGPGAGRSSKFYRPVEVDFAVSVPQRHYDLAGRILVEAVDASDADTAAALRTAAENMAAKAGETLGAQARQVAPAPAQGALEVATGALARQGFEPHQLDGHTVTLRNCPFDALARSNPSLVCVVNQALITGLLRGLGAHEEVAATLIPAAGRCCVMLTHTGAHPASR